MVVEDDSWKWGALDVMSPGMESVDDAEEFSIVDLIISFGRGEDWEMKAQGCLTPLMSFW